MYEKEFASFVGNSRLSFSILLIIFTQNLALSIILPIIYFSLIVFLLYRWSNNRYPDMKSWIPLLFSAKLLFALFFLYVYTYHYGGGELTADAGRFFKESEIFHKLFWEHPSMYFKFFFNIESDPLIVDAYMDDLGHWNAGDRTLPNDSRNVIRVNSLIYFISNGQILVHFLIFSLISFLATLDLAQFVRKWSTLSFVAVLAVLTLLPSVAFWGSSIIKEPLMLAGLCLLIRAVFDDLSFRRRGWRILLGTALMLMFKPYILGIFLVTLVFYLFFTRLLPRFQLINVMIFFIVGALIAQWSGKLDSSVELISRQQQDFMNVRDGGLYLEVDEDYYYYVYFAHRDKFEFKGGGVAVLKEPTGADYAHKRNYKDRKPIQLTDVGGSYRIHLSMSEAGSGIDVTRINGEFWTMIKMVPEVLYNTTIRPLPSDKGSWLKYPAFLENILVFLGLLLITLFARRKLNKHIKRMVWSLLLFAFLVFVVVGWTTPVLGAIVRYKVPGVLAIGIVVLVLIDFHKVCKLLGVSKKTVL
jgi:hypothetical protein